MYVACLEDALALLLDFIIGHSITYMHAYGYYCYALINNNVICTCACSFIIQSTNLYTCI